MVKHDGEFYASFDDDPKLKLSPKGKRALALRQRELLEETFQQMAETEEIGFVVPHRDPGFKPRRLPKRLRQRPSEPQS